MSKPPIPRRAWWSALAIALVAVAANLAIWRIANEPVELPGFPGKIDGFAFSAFQRYQSPLEGTFPSEAELGRDLRILSRYGKSIRTYASAESDAIPRLAQHYGLEVTAGAWLDRRLDNNERELLALKSAAMKFPNIERAIVGNEALLRSDLSVQQLTQYLDQAREMLDIPVSTAEPWHMWLRYPELADHVDYITVHLLPYWEGVPRRQAVKDVLARYDEVRARFPKKKVVIGEVGWPSNGDRFVHARPSVEDEAQFLRRFFAVAKERKLDYFVMEAFDQPWKETGEGRVGAYWGMFDADRELKFALEGPVVEDADWWKKALAASALAFLPMLWFAAAFARFALAGRLFFCLLVQLTAGVLVWSVAVPFQFYLSALDWAMFALLLPAQVAIIVILLCNAFEFTEVIWRPNWLRRAHPRSDDASGESGRTEWPFVSIHLACSNEPPEMVIATLESLAALDYEHFEVLVIDNNTEKEETWKPVEARCRELGPRFRFFHLAPWPGFKAGALNFGLKETDPRAEIIGVVDADYVVRRDWLRALVGYFDDAKTGIVQAPQAHREWSTNHFRRMCNWEYEGFFRIGMHHRNERNAIIQHGTMTLIRRAPLESTGGWAEWSICEDAELGLRLFHEGFEAHYVDEAFGRGLTPADFTAYKSQRFRWAFGAMQILRKRGAWLFDRSPLTTGQRFHFLTGWFSWFADALHLVFTLLAIGWSVGMLVDPDTFSLPLVLFVIPVLGFFVNKALFGIILYRVRVPCSWRDTLGAAVASMGLSHAIARGVLKGVRTAEHPFLRTAKSRRLRKRPSAFGAVREEALLLACLVILIFAIWFATALPVDYLEVQLWLAMLAAQSLPYLAAVVCAAVARFSGERVG